NSRGCYRLSLNLVEKLPSAYGRPSMFSYIYSIYLWHWLHAQTMKETTFNVEYYSNKPNPLICIKCPRPSLITMNKK
ncbi:hypothetical protein, partial [Bacillus velezensis]|uniref:hypothetical protein n=1 Tax=Bacillus velezensis TaxID=492670 RepID=UPI0020C0150A